MGWIGKIIGGALGFVFGGPLGLVAGIAFGNLFDRADASGYRDQQSFTREQLSPQQQTQMVFFVGAFSMLARIATVDGRLLPEEQKKVEEFIDRDLKLDTQSKAAAMRVFQAALVGGGTFRQFAQQFYQNFAHESALLELMIDIFYRVALADGELSTAEEQLIREAASIFNINAALLNSIRNRYQHGGGSALQAYAVLGLTKDATVDEIKKAYRKLSIEFHPDSVASKGLPEEFTQFATEKFRAIQAAYETLKQERDIK
ncbi:MAG: co-chaperone DjlA [Sphaerochaetaceae bacterium]|jgi:DnaJ like chaperone protein|nr:co-chaperone DjlA [Sphaerochaetaceae bacterium]